MLNGRWVLPWLQGWGGVPWTLVAGRNGFERLENPQALWLAEKDRTKIMKRRRGGRPPASSSQDHDLGSVTRMYQNGLYHIGPCCIGPVGLAKHRASKEVTRWRDAAITELLLSRLIWRCLTSSCWQELGPRCYKEVTCRNCRRTKHVILLHLSDAVDRGWKRHDVMPWVSHPQLPELLYLDGAGKEEVLSDGFPP